MEKTKTGECSCGRSVTIGSSECIFRCKHCEKVSIFTCHILPVPKDPLLIRCKQCRKEYSMFSCPQCQGYAVMKEFKPGHLYGCICGFQAMMLACNNCNAHLCLPSRFQHQMTPVTCKKCSSAFQYHLCSYCQACIFLRPGQKISQSPPCPNDQCPSKNRTQPPFQVYAQKEMQYNQPPPLQLASTNPYQTISLPSSQKKSIASSSTCDICCLNDKCMINTTCFHLSVCEQCSGKINGACPICRQVGDFKKIFKT